MKPIKNKIFAEIQEPKPTKGGLFLMDSDLEKNQAKVLAIGPKVAHIKVGDVVRFNPNWVSYYDFNGKKCVFMAEEEGADLIIV